MASQKQIEANRRNAQLSTGPTTEEGKAAVARNATTHGFYCRHLILHGESDDDLLALRKSIYDSLRPTDGLETIYVERFVVAAWKLHRLVAAEPHHARTRDNLYRNPCGDAPATHAYDYAYAWLETSANALKLVAALERSMDKTVAELMKLRKNRIDPSEEHAIAPIKPLAAPTDAPTNAIVENKPNVQESPNETRSAGMKIDIVTPMPITPIAGTNPIPVPTSDGNGDDDANFDETNPIPNPGGAQAANK